MMAPVSLYYITRKISQDVISLVDVNFNSELPGKGE